MFFYRVIPNQQHQQQVLSVASQIHGPSYHKRGNISNRSCLVYPVYFGPFWSIQSTSFTSVQFGPLRSILVQFSLFRSIRSIWFTSVQFGIFNPFSLLRSIWSNSVYFSSLRSIWSNSVYWLKNGKRQVLVENTINYLSNINCIYRISFSYHNNLLKKMRI